MNLREEYFKYAAEKKMSHLESLDAINYIKWLEEHLKTALEKNRQYEELIIKGNA